MFSSFRYWLIWFDLIRFDSIRFNSWIASSNTLLKGSNRTLTRQSDGIVRPFRIILCLPRGSRYGGNTCVYHPKWNCWDSDPCDTRLRRNGNMSVTETREAGIEVLWWWNCWNNDPCNTRLRRNGNMSVNRNERRRYGESGGINGNPSAIICQGLPSRALKSMNWCSCPFGRNGEKGKIILIFWLNEIL